MVLQCRANLRFGIRFSFVRQIYFGPYQFPTTQRTTVAIKCFVQQCELWGQTIAVGGHDHGKIENGSVIGWCAHLVLVIGTKWQFGPHDSAEFKQCCGVVVRGSGAGPGAAAGHDVVYVVNFGYFENKLKP